jgi:hypothetical protein
MQRGNTASAFYGLRSEKKGSLFLVLRFLKEGGQWKFDDGQSHYTSASEARQIFAGKGTSIFRKWQSLPTGIVPPTPPEYPMPDIIGTLTVGSIGCKTTLKYNGETKVIVDDYALVVMHGGLKTGKNRITIRVEPLSKLSGSAPTKSSPKPRSSLTIHAVESEKDLWNHSNPTVFKFESGPFTGEVTREFEVVKSVIKKSANPT